MIFGDYPISPQRNTANLQIMKTICIAALVLLTLVNWSNGQEAKWFITDHRTVTPSGIMIIPVGTPCTVYPDGKVELASKQIVLGVSPSKLGTEEDAQRVVGDLSNEQEKREKTKSLEQEKSKASLPSWESLQKQMRDCETTIEKEENEIKIWNKEIKQYRAGALKITPATKADYEGTLRLIENSSKKVESAKKKYAESEKLLQLEKSLK